MEGDGKGSAHLEGGTEAKKARRSDHGKNASEPEPWELVSRKNRSMRDKDALNF